MDLKIADLKTHPAQPPGRTNDTTDLQGSIRDVGLINPITLANDEQTVLDGSRRLTACRALGHKEIRVKIADVAPDSKEALDILASANNQREMTHLELLHVLQYYEKDFGLTIYQAADRLGISATQACFLAKYAVAPEEVRQAVEKFDRSGGREGMAWSAWKEMANEPAEIQVEQLGSGRTRISQVKRDRQKRAAESKEERLVESQGDVDSALSKAKDAVDALGYVYTFLMNGAQEQDKGEIKEALTPAVFTLKQIREVVA